LVEKHFLVDGEPISASLLDFGLYFFHNARALISKGTGPYFLSAQVGEPPGGTSSGTMFSSWRKQEMGISRGTIRATVLLETILAGV
jgi:malate synthase